MAVKKPIFGRLALGALVGWSSVIAPPWPAFGQPPSRAATVTFLRATGRVIILGTHYGDQVEVSLSPSGYQLGVRAHSEQGALGRAVPPWVFPVAEVKAVEFRGGPGDDLFVNNTPIPSYAAGEEGNDVLIGGSNVDVLYGDAGNDWLIGHDGDDALSGDGHLDTLLGGNGHDWLIRGADTTVD